MHVLFLYRFQLGSELLTQLRVLLLFFERLDFSNVLGGGYVQLVFLVFLDLGLLLGLHDASQVEVNQLLVGTQKLVPGRGIDEL